MINFFGLIFLSEFSLSDKWILLSIWCVDGKRERESHKMSVVVDNEGRVDYRL